MRVSKVNGYKTERNTNEGYLIDEKAKEIKKFSDFNKIEHIQSCVILTKAFKKGVYGEKRIKQTDKDFSKKEEINKKRKAIKSFVSKLQLEDKKIKFNGDAEELRACIIHIASCDFPEKDQYGELTKEKIISFSFKKKALLQFNIHVLIACLVDEYKKKKDKDEKIDSEDLIRLYEEIVVPRLDKHDTKIASLHKSIKNNKIQVNNTNDKKEFYENLVNKEIDTKELSVKYELDELVEKIKVTQGAETFKKMKYYDKNSRIKKVLQAHQKELMGKEKFYNKENRKTDLKYYDDEIVVYFHRHFPVRRKQRTVTFNCDRPELLDVNKINKEVKLQMENKRITHFITKGKYEYYSKTHDIDIGELSSNDLQVMHIEDVFSRKLSSTITYAVNGFRNEVFSEYQRALLNNYKYELGKDYHSLIEDINILQSKRDFLLNSKSMKQKNQKVLRAMHRFQLLIKFMKNNGSNCICEQSPELYEFSRNSIYAFRNTSFHYQTINTEFLQDKKAEIQYFKNRIDNKSAIIPKMEVMKAYDNGVFHYFDLKTVLDLYQNYSLYIPRANAKMPQFKKVIKAVERVDKFAPRGLLDSLSTIAELFQHIEENKEFQNGYELSRKQAVRYLLLKIYHAHTKEIKKNALGILDEFLKSKKILDLNNNGFESIKTINSKVKVSPSEEDFEALISAIQEDRNKYEEEKWKECKLAYDFINELTAIAFLQVLNRKEYHFIFNNNACIKCKKEDVIEVFEKHPVSLTNIKELNINHQSQDDLFYAFYAMLLFLSKARLSELHNNIITYKQAMKKINTYDDANQKLFKTIDIDSIEKAIRIIVATHENEEIDVNRYEYILRKFLNYKKLKEVEEYNPSDAIDGERQQFYIQKNKQNERDNEEIEKLIQFTQIIEADREDLIRRYKDYYADSEYKISKEDTNRLCILEKSIPDVIKDIECIKKEIKRLEEEKEKNRKIRNKKERDIKNKTCVKTITTLKEVYTEKFYKRREYDQLKNHVLFTNVSKMNRLLVDLYSRLNGLIAVAEKDLQYLYCGIKEELYKGNKIWYEIQNTTSIIKFNDITVRNKIAHFEYMRKNEEVEKVTFFEQLNKLRKLLYFDRKLKNAVTKTVINTFEKNGYVLKFKFKEHKIHSFSIASKPNNDRYLVKSKDKQSKDYFLEMIKVIIFNGCNVDNSIEQKIVNQKKKQ